MERFIELIKKAFLFLFISTFWFLFLSWLYLVKSRSELPLMTVNQSKLITETQDQVQNIANWADKFQENFSFTAKNFRELSVFARSKGEKLSALDAFSERINYLALDEKNWLVRSFAKGKIEDSISTQDNILRISKQKKPLGLRTHEEWSGFFPYFLVLGSFSPNKKWFAELYVHKEHQSSLLLVKNTLETSPVFVAFHDKVEEFLWLEDSEHLVFTASGSEKYRDGFYLWDLRKKTYKNLILENSLSHYLASNKGQANFQWFLSIAAYFPKKRILYLHKSKRVDDFINPHDFFSHKNISEFKISKDYSEISSQNYLSREENKVQRLENYRIRSLEAWRQIKCKDAHFLQKIWCQNLGDRQQLEHKLRTYKKKIKASSLSFFTDWFLLSLYHDELRKRSLFKQENSSFDSSKRENYKQWSSEHLTAEAIKIAESLVESDLCPTWIKATSEAYLFALSQENPEYLAPFFTSWVPSQ